MKNIEKVVIKLDEYSKLINVLSTDTESLKKVARFDNAFNQLTANHKKLEELHSIWMKDVTPFEKTKNKKRADLEKHTMQVIRIMQVFAYDKKKKNLQKQLECLSSDYVKNASDLDLIKIAKKIWLIANKHEGTPLSFVNKIKSTLNPDNSLGLIKFEQKYGLSQDMIRNIEKASLQFIDSIHPYEAELNGKTKTGNEIKKLLKDTDKLLTNNIDRYVLLFNYDKPGYYKEYRWIRENSSTKKVHEPDVQSPLKVDMVPETEEHNLVTTETHEIIAENKPKPRTVHRVIPEKKEEL